MRNTILVSLVVALATFLPGFARSEVLRFPVWDAWRADVAATLRDSADPQDRALSIIMGPPLRGSNKESPDFLRELARDLPRDAGVQFLVRGLARSTDPALAARTLSRLHALEPDNAAVWMEDLQDAAGRRDATGVEAALAGMAGSARFDDHLADWLGRARGVGERFPAPATVLNEIGRENLPEAPEWLLSAADAVAVQNRLALPSYQSLTRACTIDAASDLHVGREAHCLRIGRLLAAGPNLIANQIGFAVLLASGTWTAADEAAAREQAWLRDSWSTASQAEAEATQAGTVLAFQNDWIDTGSEIEAIRRGVERAGLPTLPPADWAAAPFSPFGAGRLADREQRVADVAANPF